MDVHLCIRLRIRMKDGIFQNMKVIPVRIPDKIVEAIDKLVDEGIYANRSAAVRVIVTRYILDETNLIPNHH